MDRKDFGGCWRMLALRRQRQVGFLGNSSAWSPIFVMVGECLASAAAYGMIPTFRS